MGAEYGGTGVPREYFGIVGGKLVKKVEESEAVDPQTRGLLHGYETRKNKNGVQVYERVVTYGVSGMLKRLEFTDGNFGKEIHFVVEEDGKEFVVQISPAVNANRTFTDFARTLITQLPLVDFSYPVKIKSYKFSPPDGSKDKYGVTLLQHLGDNDWASIKQLHGEKLEEIKKSIPSGKKVEDGVGGITWDFKEATIKTFEILQEQIQRFVDFKNSAPQPESPESEQPEPAMAEADDDLPF